LDSVASAARLSSEQIHNHASKQLSVASCRLRDELAKERKAREQVVATLRTELEAKAGHDELDKRSDALQASAENAKERVGLLEVSNASTKAWLEGEARLLNERWQSGHSEASDIKQRLQRENAALGGELSNVRAATTSLTHGVLRALQILGLLHELPQQAQPRDASRATPTRWGVDVEDLVEWEKTGRSLADRISLHWNSYAPAGTPTLLELLTRKADQGDMKIAVGSLRQLLNHSPDSPRKGLTPSTAAGAFSDCSPLPFEGATPAPHGFVSPFSAASPTGPAPFGGRPASSLGASLSFGPPKEVSHIRPHTSADFNRTH